MNRWMIGKTEESMGGRKNECMGERKEGRIEEIWKDSME